MKTLNVADMSLDALIALRQQSAEIAAACAADVEAIREKNAGVINAKNATDHGNTLKNGLWANVFNVIAKVAELTKDHPEIRYQVFTDTLAEFLVLPAHADGTKPKMTTAGQYASTGRKLLIDVITQQNRDPEEFAEMSVKDVRELFRDRKDAAKMEAIGEAGKRLRYVVKHGTEDEKARIAGILGEVDKLWNPVKARKDASKNKAKADAELRNDRQQAPSAPAVLETVAANIVGDDGEGEVKVAVNQ